MNENMRNDATEREETGRRTLRDWWRARHRIAMEALFLGVVVLTVIGVALTNIAPAASYRYWLFTVGLFAIAGVLTGNLRAREEHLSLFHVTLEQTVHWAVTLLAVLIVHLMLLSGRLTYEATGLILMLLLGQDGPVRRLVRRICLDDRRRRPASVAGRRTAGCLSAASG